MDIYTNKDYPIWRKLNTLAVVATFMFFMVYDLMPAIWGTVYTVWYRAFAIVLLSFYFYFRRLNDGTEQKLLLLYCAWLAATYILNGNFSLLKGWEKVLTSLTICFFFGTPIVLCREKRMKMLDILAASFVLLYTCFALVALYSVFSGAELVNPFTGDLVSSLLMTRLRILGRGPNWIGNWYFISISFCVYLFMRYKSLLVRVLAVFCAAVGYVVITMSFSRNSMLGFAICGAMFAALLIINRVKPASCLKKIAIFALTLAVVVPLLFVSFTPVSKVVYPFIPETEVAAEPSEESAEEEGEEGEEAPANFYAENRGLADTGRLPIYYTAIDVLIHDPVRMLIGELEPMKATNQALIEVHERINFPHVDFEHHHCSYLDVLMRTGVPGFALIMAFVLLLLKKMIVLYFSEKEGVDIALKTLTVMLSGLLLYSTLESCIFIMADIRSIVFYIVAGVVVASYKDAYTA